MEGRQILDGIVVAHETIHSLKMRKNIGMLLKLDMSKAFDHLNWIFLHDMLASFGFCIDWILWVKNLLSSVGIILRMEIYIKM